MQKRRSYNGLLLWTEREHSVENRKCRSKWIGTYSSAIVKGYCQTCLCSTKSGTFTEYVDWNRSALKRQAGTIFLFRKISQYLGKMTRIEQSLLFFFFEEIFYFKFNLVKFYNNLIYSNLVINLEKKLLTDCFLFSIYLNFVINLKKNYWHWK